MSKPFSLYMLVFPTGKSYIGMAQSVRKRLNGHRSSARCGSRSAVHGAIRKHGWKSVQASVLCIGTREYVRDMEVAAIARFGTIAPAGYNLTEGADFNPMLCAPTLKRFKRMQKGNKHLLGKRWKLSAEAKEKHRQTALRQWANPTMRARIMASLTKEKL